MGTTDITGTEQASIEQVDLFADTNPDFDPNWFTDADDEPISQSPYLADNAEAINASSFRLPEGLPAQRDGDVIILPGPAAAVRLVSPADVITLAVADLGYKEGPNNDNKFGKWYGVNNEPWCAMAVSYWCHKGGLAAGTFAKAASCTVAMHWAIRNKMWISNPMAGRAGDQAIYNARAGSSSPVHTGIVEASLGNGVYRCIEGNTNANGSANGDGVYRKRRKAERIIGFIRPNYAGIPLVRLSMLKPGLTNPDIRIMQDALEKEFGITLKGAGHYGPVTTSAVANWQMSLGFTGADADGVIGSESAQKLGAKYGFAVIV